jgi:hypothetical protein
MGLRMGIMDSINSKAIHMGNHAKVGAQNFFLLSCKILSGLILGLTFALAGQEVFQYGPILFWFVILTVASAFYRITKMWGGIGLLIFDLLCILAALLIRMYVVIAPG